MANPNPYGGTSGDEPGSSVPPGTPPPPGYQPPSGYPPPPPAGYPPPPPAGYPPPPQGGYYPPQSGYQPPPGYPPPGGAPGAFPGAVGQPGTLGDRFVARFLDGLIIGVVNLVLSIMLRGISNSWLFTGFIYSVVAVAVNLGYFAYLESTRGQTLGKQVMKLKVVGPDHVGNPTLEQAIRRNIFLAFGVLGIVPILGTTVGGLATLAAVIVIVVNINSDPQRQHAFDKFAGGTQVIKIG